MFPAYSVILTCSPSYKLVFCAWVSQILLSNQYNIQSNHPTGSHSCCSRRLHLQGEPPTFSLFRASFITCCHHFIWSFRCHLLLHAFVSAVYSASTSQILACFTCENSSLVVVEWADGSFLPVSGLIMKLLGQSLVCTILILVLLVKYLWKFSARPAYLGYFPHYMVWAILLCICFFPAFKTSIWNRSGLDLVTCFKRISLKETCVR